MPPVSPPDAFPEHGEEAAPPVESESWSIDRVVESAKKFGAMVPKFAPGGELELPAGVRTEAEIQKYREDLAWAFGTALIASIATASPLAFVAAWFGGLYQAWKGNPTAIGIATWTAKCDDCTESDRIPAACKYDAAKWRKWRTGQLGDERAALSMDEHGNVYQPGLTSAQAAACDVRENQKAACVENLARIKDDPAYALQQYREAARGCILAAARAADVLAMGYFERFYKGRYFYPGKGLPSFLWEDDRYRGVEVREIPAWLPVGNRSLDRLLFYGWRRLGLTQDDFERIAAYKPTVGLVPPGTAIEICPPDIQLEILSQGLVIGALNLKGNPEGFEPIARQTYEIEGRLGFCPPGPTCTKPRHTWADLEAALKRLANPAVTSAPPKWTPPKTAEEVLTEAERKEAAEAEAERSRLARYLGAAGVAVATAGAIGYGFYRLTRKKRRGKRRK